MKIAVIGTGGIGGFYGAKLAKLGCDVHFLFHSDYNYVLDHGLTLNSPDGSFHLDKVKAYNNTQDIGVCDIVLVALKTTNQLLLNQYLPPLLSDKTIVVLIQNGIGVEEDVQKMFKNVQLCAGLAFIGTSKTKTGVVDHQCYGQLNLAPYSVKNTDLLNEFCQTLNNSNVKSQVLEYHKARWSKAIWNMAFNGLSVVLNANTDEMLETDDLKLLVKNLMLEVIGAANACGVKELTNDNADAMIDMTLKMNNPYYPSMKLDYDFKREMEIKYIYSKPIEIAKAHGFDMPRCKMLESQLIYLGTHNK